MRTTSISTSPTSEFQRDRYEAALAYLQADLAIVRRRGSRPGEWSVLAERTYPLYMLGRWDEALATAAEVPEEKLSAALTMSLLASRLEIQVHRGDPAEARRLLSLFEHLAQATDVQDRGGVPGRHAAVLRAEGRLAEALAAGVEAAEVSRELFGISTQTVKQGLVEAIEAALGLGRAGARRRARGDDRAIPPGLQPPYLAAQADRFRALLAGADEAADERVRGRRRQASARSASSFWLAVTLARARRMARRAGAADEAAPLLAEAREIFERLEATPWLDRLELAEAALTRPERAHELPVVRLRASRGKAILRRVRRGADACLPRCGAALAGTEKFCPDCGARSRRRRWTLRQKQRDRRPSDGSCRCCSRTSSASRRPPKGRDAEDTRELLTRYFDTSRTIIERYGGTVEKFIGDAVMAVWGAPVANEDDAERAVRAALELVDAVPGLDPALQARAGVLTGEAAVTLGATDQGMVAGDLVNTAARIQSAAEPGTVLVGETTRAGDRGRDRLRRRRRARAQGQEPSRCSSARALRVAAQRRGEGRSAGLEAPFVGRAAELRLVKELFHASADESRARLVSVIGVAGIGKSRLSWEFEKYIDGLAADVWWHRGRCLSYGEGVAYWALAEMVRGRAKILEDEDAGSSRRSCAPCSRPTSPTPTSAPGSSRGSSISSASPSERLADREDLFSAWRRFFERLAEQGPLVMVFEDIHWADEGLVAFVESPARLGPAPPDLRPHAGAARGRRPPSRLPRLDAERGDAAARAARRRRHGRAARRPRPRAARRRPRAGSATRPTGSRSTPSRRCGCCAIAACSSRSATSVRRHGRPDRVRGARDAARADRLAARRRARGRAHGCCRTRRCSARRSRRAGLPRSRG